MQTMKLSAKHYNQIKTHISNIGLNLDNFIYKKLSRGAITEIVKKYCGKTTIPFRDFIDECEIELNGNRFTNFIAFSSTQVGIPVYIPVSDLVIDYELDFARLKQFISYKDSNQITQILGT